MYIIISIAYKMPHGRPDAGPWAGGAAVNQTNPLFEVLPWWLCDHCREQVTRAGALSG